MASQEAPLPISAAVCTRNRGTAAAVTVRSILANTHPHFELVVIDQSTDDVTGEALAPFLEDCRFRYVRSAERGLGNARNQALREARGALVAFTDDDCEVPTDWLAKVEAGFARDERIAILFCNVQAAEHDTHEGFIPAYMRTDSQILVSVRDKLNARGIGAGLAVRRDAALALGGFDGLLGAGGLYPSCEDGDMAVRALLKGYRVLETNEVAVLHYGYRAHTEGRELSRRDWVGIGAAYAKPLKAGHLRFAIVPAYELFAFAIWPPIRDVLTLRRPRGLTRILGFFSGFRSGLRHPVDRDTLLFVPQKPSTP